VSKLALVLALLAFGQVATAAPLVRPLEAVKPVPRKGTTVKTRLPIGVPDLAVTGAVVEVIDLPRGGKLGWWRADSTQLIVMTEGAGLLVDISEAAGPGRVMRAGDLARARPGTHLKLTATMTTRLLVVHLGKPAITPRTLRQVQAVAHTESQVPRFTDSSQLQSTRLDLGDARGVLRGLALLREPGVPEVDWVQVLAPTRVTATMTTPALVHVVDGKRSTLAWPGVPAIPIPLANGTTTFFPAGTQIELDLAAESHFIVVRLVDPRTEEKPTP
jgi:hypothetical protein